MKTAKRAAMRASHHWKKLAKQAEAAAEWDRKMGISPRGILSANDHKAKLYRDTAEALKLEAETGLVHCNCHVKVIEQCPTNPRNLVRGRV